MELLDNEQDQIRAIKDWWRDYGKFTVVVIVLSIAVSFGWQYLQGKKRQYSEYASMLFEQTQYHLAAEKYADFESQANYLATHYKRAPYASLAKLALATRKVKENKLDDAALILNEVVLHSNTPAIRQVARLRQARILLAQKKYDQAQKVLSDIDDKAYLPLISEIRGDIFSAEGDYVEARKAYQTAIKGIAEDEMNRSILQMKYERISDHL